MGKNPLFSKTLWANLLAIGGILAQARYGYVFPPEGQAVALAVGNLILRVATGQPIDWKKIKVSGLGLLLWSLVSTAAFMTLLQGCAFRALEERPVLTELAVRAAVGRVLDEHPSWIEPARQISGDAIRLLGESEEVSLAALEGYVVGQIPWDKLTIEEEELLRVLIRAVRDETETYLAQQGVKAPQEAAVQVAAVLGWIYQSAEIRMQRRAGIDLDTYREKLKRRAQENRLAFEAEILQAGR